MGSDAGFGAAVAIREEVLQGFLDVLHRGVMLPRHIDLGNANGIGGRLYLDVPRLVCDQANGNRFALHLTATGPLTTPDPAGGPDRTRDVDVTAIVTVRPVLSLTPAPTSTPPPPGPLPMELAFGLDANSATLVALEVTPRSGVPLSAVEQALITARHQEIQTTLRTVLQKAGALGPPLSLSFLGPVATTVFDPVQFRVRDGALVVGFDVDFGTTRTSGDPAKLANICRTNSIGLWLNPLVIDLAVGQARTEAASKLPSLMTLDSLVFACNEGSLHVDGAATVPGAGSLTFSFDLFPRLVAPAIVTTHVNPALPREIFQTVTPAHEAMFLEIANVVIGGLNRTTAIWETEIVLALVSGGVLGAVVEGILEWALDGAATDLTATRGFVMAPRTHSFAFPKLSSPTVSARVEEFEIHGVDRLLGTTDVGIYTGLSVRFVGLSFPGRIDGPLSLAVDELAVLPVRYEIRLPAVVDAGSPYVNVEWILRRTDTNAMLRRQFGPVSTNTRFDLTGDPNLLSAPNFSVECTVSGLKAPMTRTMTYFHGLTSLHVADRLDRTHPFVRWQHDVRVPQVKVHPGGYRTIGVAVGHRRQSDIHRTEFPGRCRMAASYSSAVLPVADGSSRPHLEYLDQLPFPRTALDANRALVCDYCFYGGPTRTVALIP